jgi:hypothetical protein
MRTYLYLNACISKHIMVYDMRTHASYIHIDTFIIVNAYAA